MKIYIAGKYEARERLRSIRAILQERGHEVISSWLDETAPKGEVTDEYKASVAIRDFREILNADLFILDTLDESNTGGREVELGWALALTLMGLHKMKPIRIGPDRNVYHMLPSAPSWEAFLSGEDS